MYSDNAHILTVNTVTRKRKRRMSSTWEILRLRKHSDVGLKLNNSTVT